MDLTQIKLYKKRWLILLIYFFNTVICGMHWLQFSAIADVIVDYYQVSYEAVDWSSMIFLLTYIVFSVPRGYFVEKKGLRATLLLSTIGTAIGAWIKVASVNPNRYWVLMLGQTFIGSFQVLILPIPSKVAAVWFGKKEVPLITSIGSISIQLRIAAGLIIPPFIVSSGAQEYVTNGLKTMSYIFAIVTTVYIPLLYFFVDKQPPCYPSIAQLKKHDASTTKFFDMAKTALKNRSFSILVLLYGFDVGTSCAISTLLNQIVLNHYPDATRDVGVLGLFMSLAGIVGSCLSGIVLTKFRKYKLTTFVAAFGCFITTTLFLFLVPQSLLVTYILGILAYCFFYANINVGFELGVEVTYPVPEDVSGALMMLSVQVFGIVTTYMYSYLSRGINELVANLCICGSLLVINSLLLFVRFDLKRMEVEKRAQTLSEVVALQNVN